MTSLRNRIAGFMILAIVTVIALATLVAMQMMQRPLPETATIPVARQIAWNVRFAETDPQAAQGAGPQGLVLVAGVAHVRVGADMAGGDEDAAQGLTATLNADLAAVGRRLPQAGRVAGEGRRSEGGGCDGERRQDGGLHRRFPSDGSLRRSLGRRMIRGSVRNKAEIVNFTQ